MSVGSNSRRLDSLKNEGAYLLLTVVRRLRQRSRLEGPRAHLDCSVALELLPQATTGPWELPEASGFY